MLSNPFDEFPSLAPQIYLPPGQVRRRVGRIRALKHEGSRCFWTASVSVSPDTVVNAFMFGYVVAEIGQSIALIQRMCLTS